MSNGSEDLQNALRLLSKESRHVGASPAVRAALLGEMRSRRRRALAARWWPAAVAAAVVIGVWLGLPRPANQPQIAVIKEVPAPVPAVVAEPQVVVVEKEPAARPASVRRAKSNAPLVVDWTPLTPWYVHSGLPAAQQGQMVFVEVGPATARQFGLPDAGPMKAQVYLGDDGMARAIRLVRTPKIAKGE